jgi:hypothetical protein
MLNLKEEKTVTQRIVKIQYQSSPQSKQIGLGVESVDKATGESLGVSKPIRVALKRSSQDKFLAEIALQGKAPVSKEITLDEFETISDNPKDLVPFLEKYVLPII